MTQRSVSPAADRFLRRNRGHERMKSGLSASWQRLVGICQRLNYGSIVGLTVRNGEPDFAHIPKITRRGRPTKSSASDRSPPVEGFVVKKHIRDLVEWVRDLGDETEVSIDITTGLPISWSADGTHLFFDEQA